jgi:hypothetical protein
MPLDVGLVSRHPAPGAVVAAALAATAVVFDFFRPQYHPKGEDSLVKVDGSLYPPASSGWNWAGGQPGFRFGEHEEKWNFSEVQAAELAPARAAARRWGVAPPSVRLIGAMRLGPHDLNMIVAGTNAADKTCIGFVTPSAPAEYFCPPRLGSQSGFVLAMPRSWQSGGVLRHPAWLLGVVRADVTRVGVDQRLEWEDETVLDAANGSYWGTWELSLADFGRSATVTVYRKDGKVTSRTVDVQTRGDRVIPIPG